MDEWPVLDNHLHLDPANGQGFSAVEEFIAVGGTHLLIVNKPSWHLGDIPETGADFQSVFETTCAIAEQADRMVPGAAWPVLGVHPGLISRLIEEREYTPADAASLMCAGLDEAATYVADGPGLALKSGRPHYEVSEAVWEASNQVLRHALSLGADCGCAVQLHTEAAEDLTEIGAWAEAAGLPATKVVKHYAAGKLEGVTPSVMSEKDRLERAATRADPFLMETDFVDDPERPGAVLGPKTVPRRVNWLLDNGYEDAVERAHVSTPELVYGIDTRSPIE